MSRALQEEITSPGGRWKVEIWKTDDGTLRLVLRHHVVEVVPEYGHVGSYWVEVPTHTSITDSLDIARSIANEMLAQHASGD